MSIAQSNVNFAENHELNQLGEYKLVNEIILNTILPSKNRIIFTGIFFR